MQVLKDKHPDIFNRFKDGSFVAHKTKRPFSAIAPDQAHEQENASIKGKGGAVGLTESASALKRWMVAGPEISRMVTEFEDTIATECTKHHEQSHGFQESFKKDIQAVISTSEESNDLIAIDST